MYAIYYAYFSSIFRAANDETGSPTLRTSWCVIYYIQGAQSGRIRITRQKIKCIYNLFQNNRTLHNSTKSSQRLNFHLTHPMLAIPSKNDKNQGTKFAIKSVGLLLIKYTVFIDKSFTEIKLQVYTKLTNFTFFLNISVHYDYGQTVWPSVMRGTTSLKCNLTYVKFGPTPFDIWHNSVHTMLGSVE